MADYIDPIYKLRRNPKGFLPYLVFFLLALLLVIDFFSPGYILTLDMVFSDGAFSKSGLNAFYGLTNSYSSAPFIVFLGFLDMSFSAVLIQKLSFFLIFFLSGISAYKLCPEEWGPGRYFAGLLYMLNPFVYVRFLAGHWLLLLAYAVTPILVKSFMDFFKAPSRKRAAILAILLTLVFVIETHTPFLLLMIFCVFLAAHLAEHRRNKSMVFGLSKSVAIFLLFLLILNSYWLIPNLISNSAPLGEITNSDLYAFTTKQDINFNTLFTTASMYGFWRGGYIYMKELLPYWYLFFIFILFLAVHGFVSNYKNENYGVNIKAFGALAVFSVILAAGISGPFAGAFEVLFNNLVFFKGFREPQKFVAILVLTYAYLGGMGVAEFEKMVRTDGIMKRPFTNKKFGACAIIALALVTPLIYSFTMFDGFWGQLKPADYPKDWYEVNNFLNKDKQDFNILFLPWHLYMDFKWIPNSQKRIANPSNIFFDKPVIFGDNMEVGSIYSSSVNPVSSYIESLLEKRDKINNFGELMVPLNVKYVLLTKEVDYNKYFFLFNQTDLELVRETENFYIFKNDHPVSRFYQSATVNFSVAYEEFKFISTLKPLEYTQTSPVTYNLKADAGYIVFVPPNSNSEYWELNGKPSLAQGFYSVYPAVSGIMYYSRFNTYLLGYIVSLVMFIGSVIWIRKER